MAWEKKFIFYEFQAFYQQTTFFYLCFYVYYGSAHARISFYYESDWLLIAA